jgi:hypothetical protein
MSNPVILFAQAPISETCREELAAAGMAVLELHAFGTLPPDIRGDVLVLMRKAHELWWDIGWRDDGEDILAGPWRYTLELAEAAPVAWCRLPEIDPDNEHMRVLLAAPTANASASPEEDQQRASVNSPHLPDGFPVTRWGRGAALAG